MRIKRFIASDMRTALRMVRDEQGPDAVILSNRPCAEGVEVVSATDYDEALVHQALRAAAPGIATPSLPSAAPAPVAPNAAASASTATATPAPAAAPAAQPLPAFATARAGAASTAATPPSVRETLASRARAVFKIGDAIRPASNEPTLAELTADAPPTETAAAAPAALPHADVAAADAGANRFDAMMAALGAPTSAAAEAEPADDVVTFSGAARHAAARVSPPASSRPSAEQDAPATVAAAQVPQVAHVQEPVAPAPKLELSLEPLAEREPGPDSAPQPEADAAAPDTAPRLQVVPRWDADPAVAAMREELATMRQLIEREMGQFAVERLRGSPARAAAFDTLLGYGCDETLAQTLAAKIDPALDPARVHAPMLAELARMLTIAREEPIDDVGGNNNVIALVGPTGAGKTTTAAKIAARFAARHRARDVALVTTDFERVGACEQLHAPGRRLGITVCEANGPEALQQTLDQLQDYPLVVVDTAGYGARDRALLGQITWLRATRNLRSLLVLPANSHPHDMNEVVRRYRMASPEGVVLTKLDETGRLGAALSTVIRNGLSLAYTTAGQQVATDLARADASHLVLLLEKLRRAADNPLATEDRHAVA